MIRRKAITIKKYCNLMKQDEIHEMIIANKKRLDKAARRKEVIYYLDECMFTVKTFMTTDWSPKRIPKTPKPHKSEIYSE